jgi:hypothetical protein
MMNRLVRAQMRRMEARPVGGGSNVMEMPLAETLAAVGIRLPLAAIA